MYQFDDFQIVKTRDHFDASNLLKKAVATLVDKTEYDAAGIAQRLSIRTLEAARFVAAFSAGNIVGNPIHFVKSQTGTLVGSKWRFSMRSIEESTVDGQEARFAA